MGDSLRNKWPLIRREILLDQRGRQNMKALLALCTALIWLRCPRRDKDPEVRLVGSWPSLQGNQCLYKSGFGAGTAPNSDRAFAADVDDFVDTQGMRFQSSSILFNKQPAKVSARIRSKPPHSTDFNTHQNRIRDQGVGGSNPLAPINDIDKIHPIPECIRNGV